MHERPIQHIPDQEGIRQETKVVTDKKIRPTRQQRKLQKHADEIEKYIEDLEKSQIVTHETLNLEFTI